MPDITAPMVSKLREQTGAGMMECKRALVESEGDIERARDILRSRGQAGAEKRAGRAAADGVVATAGDNRTAALVELNSETDFVARNPEFVSLAKTLAESALKAGSEDVAAVTADQSVSEKLEAVRHSMRENIVFRRIAYVAPQPDSFVASYVHTVTNKIGALVELKGDPGSTELQELARGIAMHVAAAKPDYLRREDVPAELVEREKQVLAEKTRNEGKPEAAVPKIVEGRLGKFYEGICLVEQPYVRDPSKKIGDMLRAAGADAKRFALFVVGQE